MDTNQIHQPEEDDLDLFLLIRELLDHWLCILLAGLIFASAGFLFANSHKVHHYQASFDLMITARADVPRQPGDGGYVDSKDPYNPEDEHTPTVEDIALAKSIAPTYADLLQSNTVLEPLLREMDSEMDYDTFVSHLRVSQKKELPILHIVYSGTDAKQVEQTAFQLARIPPKALSNLAKVGSCHVITSVEVEKTGTTPSVKKYTILGAAAGMLAAMVVIFLRFLLNLSIIDDHDVRKYLDVPVLGVIPQIKEGK